MRHYSPADIERLAARSGLTRTGLLYAGEVVNFHDRVYQYGPSGESSRAELLRSFVSQWIGRLSPVYPFLFMREADEPWHFACGPRRKRIYNPDTFLLALRKPPL